jgi:hypothetical protein
MKKLLFALLLFTSIAVGAEELKTECSNSLINDNVASHQGCCSHHKGVCGCGGYRLLCCDGTLSPSCECFKEDKKEETIQLQEVKTGDEA